MSWNQLQPLLNEFEALEVDLVRFISCVTIDCENEDLIQTVTDNLCARLHKINLLSVQCATSYSSVTFKNESTEQTLYASDYFANLLAITWAKTLLKISSARSESFTASHVLAQKLVKENTGILFMYRTLVELFSPQGKND